MKDRERALYEEQMAQEEASRLAGRPDVLIEGPGVRRNVTEQVVSVLDALQGSLDWGSGFLDESTTTAANELMKLLRFQCPAWDIRQGVGTVLCTRRMGHSGAHAYRPEAHKPAVYRRDPCPTS